MDTVDFTSMADGTAEEYAFLDEMERANRRDLVADIFDMFGKLAGPKLGLKIDRYQHSLQTATRAQRDGADEETVVCALLHDVGDILTPQNHSQLAAAVLRAYVSEKNHWIVEHHGVFQGYYYFHHSGRDRDAREAFRGHPHFQACADFCEKWDQNSFDPDYDTLPLDAFEPMVRRVFETPNGQYT